MSSAFLRGKRERVERAPIREWLAGIWDDEVSDRLPQQMMNAFPCVRDAVWAAMERELLANDADSGDVNGEVSNSAAPRRRETQSSLTDAETRVRARVSERIKRVGSDPNPPDPYVRMLRRDELNELRHEAECRCVRALITPGMKFQTAEPPSFNFGRGWNRSPIAKLTWTCGADGVVNARADADADAVWRMQLSAAFIRASGTINDGNDIPMEGDLVAFLRSSGEFRGVFDSLEYAAEDDDDDADAVIESSSTNEADAAADKPMCRLARTGDFVFVGSRIRWEIRSAEHYDHEYWAQAQVVLTRPLMRAWCVRHLHEVWIYVRLAWDERWTADVSSDSDSDAGNIGASEKVMDVGRPDEIVQQTGSYRCRIKCTVSEPPVYENAMGWADVDAPDYMINLDAEDEDCVTFSVLVREPWEPGADDDGWRARKRRAGDELDWCDDGVSVDQLRESDSRHWEFSLECGGCDVAINFFRVWRRHERNGAARAELANWLPRDLVGVVVGFGY